MHRQSKSASPFEKILRKRILVVESSDDEEPKATVPTIQLTPSSFMEFLLSEDIETIFRWGDGCFGALKDGILYWSRVPGLEDMSDFVKFYRMAGVFMDRMNATQLRAICDIIKKMGLKTLQELFTYRDAFEYALSLDLISVRVDGRSIDSWDEFEQFLAGQKNFEEIDVDMRISVLEADKCRKEGIETYDECILRVKYGLTLDDYSVIKALSDVFFEIDEDAELYNKPEIEDNRVVIGKKGYFERIYLEDIFEGIDSYINTLHDFKKHLSDGKVKNYDEYLLFKKKQYTLEDLRAMIDEGLVRVKDNGTYRKIVGIELKDDHIFVVDEKGEKYSLAELLSSGSPEITLPLSQNYRNYRRSKYKYYVEWKMLRNEKFSEDRAPRDLNELKQFVHLGLVKVHGRTVKDIRIKNREVFFVLDNGQEIEMYPLVTTRNEFVIEGAVNGKLSWIRRFIAEGFRERDALKLVLALKRYENLKNKRISLKDLSKETGIPVERLEIYLTSDRFKRFGELSDSNFYLHPDIEDFKRSVKVRRDEDYRVIVVDGRNVMYSGEEKEGRKGKVENIITVIESLVRRGVPRDRIRVIVKNADFNKNRVDNLEMLRELEKKGMITPISYGHDDMEILKIALEEENGLIISNDKYREFVGGNIKEEDIEKRRIEFTFRGRQFHIRKTSLPKLEKFIEKIKNEENRK